MQYIETHLKRIRIDRGGRTVLREIDWRIRPGERWVLLGANGAGKTQLMKLLAGDIWPTPTGRESRTYRWRGETLISPHDVKEEIAYIGAERQDKYERYDWNHRVEQVVGTGLYRTDIPRDPLTPRDRQHIAMLLRRLDITQLATRRFLSLSYGERRLTLLARTLAARPKLLLLDELFNGLDKSYRAQVLRWLEHTAKSGLPWVLATHHADDIPAAATHAAVLDSGRMVYKGVLSRAPLVKWLSHSRARSRILREASSTTDKQLRLRNSRAKRPLARTPSAQAQRGTSARTLVRLSNASVYLEGAAVLRGISFELRPGECWAVHGPNGSGKTTLLRAIYGDHPLGDSVERKGIEPGVPLYRFQRRVGWVAPHLQSDHPQHLTVAEVVQSGRYASIGLNEQPTTADRAAARRALAFFGLTRLEKRSLRELSYGQFRRVLFARAWVRQPQLLLLDEPFAGVDAATRIALLEQIGKLVLQGVAVMMATHHTNEWPCGTTHELALNRGRVMYCGAVRSR